MSTLVIWSLQWINGVCGSTNRYLSFLPHQHQILCCYHLQWCKGNFKNLPHNWRNQVNFTFFYEVVIHLGCESTTTQRRSNSQVQSEDPTDNRELPSCMIFDRWFFTTQVVMCYLFKIFNKSMDIDFSFILCFFTPWI